MFPLVHFWSWETEGFRIPLPGKFIDDYSSGVSKVIEFRNLVKGFSNAIVNCSSKNFKVIKSVYLCNDAVSARNQDIDAGCDLNYTANKGIEKDIEYAASASLGFGGHNSCLILRKYTDL